MSEGAEYKVGDYVLAKIGDGFPRPATVTRRLGGNYFIHFTGTDVNLWVSGVEIYGKDYLMMSSRDDLVLYFPVVAVVACSILAAIAGYEIGYNNATATAASETAATQHGR